MYLMQNVWIGGIFLIWKSTISFFSNSLVHSLISELCTRLFGKRDIIDFHIEKNSPIGTTFNVEMYGIWYNSLTKNYEIDQDARLLA